MASTKKGQKRFTPTDAGDAAYYRHAVFNTSGLVLASSFTEPPKAAATADEKSNFVLGNLQEGEVKSLLTLFDREDVDEVYAKGVTIASIDFLVFSHYPDQHLCYGRAGKEGEGPGFAVGRTGEDKDSLWCVIVYQRPVIAASAVAHLRAFLKTLRADASISISSSG